MSRQHARNIALEVALVGVIVLAVAILGPWIGLGIAENFLAYRWFGCTRTDLAQWAATVIALAIGFAAIVSIRRIGAVLVNLAATLIALAIALVIIESIARAIDGKPVLAWRNWLAERNALLTTEAMSDHDPIIGWVIKSNIRAAPDDEANSITTGPHGIRLNHPNDSPPPKSGILAVGDSFTAGSEVGDRYAWPAQLQTLLGRPVINAASGGWATDQIVLRAESLLPVLAPTTVILSFLEDDIQRSAYRVYGNANKPYFTVENGVLVHHNRPVPRYTGRIDEIPRWLVLPSHLYLVLFVMDRLGWSNWWQSLSSSYIKADNDPVAVTCALLDRFQRQLKTSNINLLLVIQYGSSYPRGQPVHALEVMACARQLGIDSLDLWDDIEGLRQRSPNKYHRLWVPHGPNIYGHMSARGNRLVAERIAARLQVSPTR